MTFHVNFCLLECLGVIQFSDGRAKNKTIINTNSSYQVGKCGFSAFQLTCSARHVRKNKEFEDRNVVLSRRNTRVLPLLSILPLSEMYLRVQVLLAIWKERSVNQ